MNKKKGSEATVDMSEIKKGDPVKAFIIQVAALSFVSGHTGSGDHGRNPEFNPVTKAARSPSFRNVVPKLLWRVIIG